VAQPIAAPEATALCTIIVIFAARIDVAPGAVVSGADTGGSDCFYLNI